MISFILRPIKLKDLDQLKALSDRMNTPIASLPNDRMLLKKRIELSVRSFKKTVSRPGGEYYLFVLEDTVTGEIIGASAINARVGGQGFFFVYEIQQEVFSYPPLRISKTVDVLHFKRIHKGPSELCSLYLSREFRKRGLGTLLSFGRYFFMNAFSKRFAGELVANLQGVRDEEGHSPFWEGIGDVFFGESLATADTMKSLGHKNFIRALMPRHPIYVSLLSKKAQVAIGEVGIDAQPALHLLEKEGFRKNEWVDIFDAGPYVFAKKEEIRIFQNMRSGKVSRIIEMMSGESGYLIANNVLDFRVCIGDILLSSDGTVHIDTNAAQALNVQLGSVVSFAKY